MILNNAMHGNQLYVKMPYLLHSVALITDEHFSNDIYCYQS